MDLQTLSADSVLLIHDHIVREFATTPNPIFPPGIKHESLLHSAIGRQHTSLGSVLKYATAIESAAALTFGLCCNHPFHNGNKRTALVSMLAHLEKNKLTLTNVDQFRLEKFIINVADHAHEKIIDDYDKYRKQPLTSEGHDREHEAMVRWLKAHTRRVTRGERTVTFRELRSLLKGFGYQLEKPDRGSIEIVKYEKRTSGFFRKVEEVVRIHIINVSYPGEHSVVGPIILKLVRKKCRLTEEDGVTSDMFYDGDTAIIDGFINQYRNILRRLANK